METHPMTNPPRWVAYGPVRGKCPHRHRTARTATLCAHQDGNAAARLGGYSDRTAHTETCRKVLTAGQEPCTCNP